MIGVNRTVWTNGVFDILHPGHIALLKMAADCGDRLIVGLDSDRRVSERKGLGRPINNFQFRKLMLESIRYVDEVVGFDTDKELAEIIRSFSPELIVESPEWVKQQAELAPEFEVVAFGKVGGFSSSGIIEKIRSL